MTTRSAWAQAQSLVAAIVKDPEFERLHPRGRDGRFIEKGGFVKFLDPRGLLWRTGKAVDFLSDGRVKVSYKGSDGKDVEEIKHKSSLYAADKPKATLSPSGWKKTGAQAGSNPGGFFEDKGGDSWYVKTPKSKLHVGNENLANRLYRAAGAPAPETAVSPDGKNFMTKIEKSSPWNSLSGSELDEAKEEIAKNFVVDAWLANWDAPLNDNLRVTSDGVPLRVDAGGAVLFRARGTQRTLTPNVGELKTMRDPAVSPSGARVYDKVTRADEEDAVKRILAISPDTISKMVTEDGLPPHVATSLIARRAWLATHYGFQLPESTTEGRKLLDELAKTPDDLTDAEAAKVTKTVQKLAPDTAVAIAKGAPVWYKNKNHRVTGGSKAPDVMVVDKIYDDNLNDVTSDPTGAKQPLRFDLKSLDGKVSVDLVGAYDLEILRENFASESAKYSTGESPQIGDKVDSGKLGKGVVRELYPLYMKVTYEDGKSRVGRIARSSLVAKTGTFDAGTVVQTPQAAAIQIGEKADVSNPEGRFPVIAYSLPHRVSVLVLSNDPVAKKSIVMLSDGRKVTVPDDKLYNNEVVDRDKVAALPVRGPSKPRAPRVQPPLDVTTLPEKELAVNRSVKVKIEPGDRVIKVKQRGSSQISFMVIRKDGKLEFAGSNKGGTDQDGYAFDHVKRSIDSVYKTLQHAGDVWDVTPAKYDQAATQLGAKQIDWSNLQKGYKLQWDAYDPASYKPPAAGSSYRSSYLTAISKTQTIDMESGDRLGEIQGLKGAPELGMESYYVDPSDPTAKRKYLPMVTLKRGDKSYYLGFGAEHANDQSKWIEIPKSDLKEIDRVQQDPWYKYDPNAGPEPVAKLSIGDVTKTDLEKASSRYGGGPAYGFNNASTQLTALMGKRTDGRAIYTTGGIITGTQDLFASLSRKAKGWDSGDLDKQAAALKAIRRTYTEDELKAMPTGTQMRNTDTDTVYTRIDTLDYWTYDASRSGGRPDQPIPGKNMATITLEPLTPPPAAPAVATPLVDITDVDGFNALHHKIETTRDDIKSGKLDDRIAEIMAINIQPVSSAYSYGRTTVWKLPDGTTHGDPYMAQFAKDQNGDQKSLLVSPAVFNAIKAITGAPTLHRGVSTQDQRDAIKEGDHFNGTGVSGNGVYTAADTGTAGSYGGNKVQLTPKPGYKPVQNDEAGAMAGEDVSEAMMERADILSKNTVLPSKEEILALDLSKTNDDPAIEMARLQAMASGGWYTSADDDAKKRWRESASAKAAVAYVAAALRANGAGAQDWTAKIKVESSGWYYSSTPKTSVSFLTEAGGSMTMTFENPKGMGGTRATRGAGSSLDPKTNFFVSTKLDSVKPGGDESKIKDRIGQSYDSGWFMDQTTEILEQSGVGEAIADNASVWQELQAQTRKLDSRITFISDTGRWALASGYDAIHVPGVDYYIFTNRAAFVIKK